MHVMATQKELDLIYQKARRSNLNSFKDTIRKHLLDAANEGNSYLQINAGNVDPDAFDREIIQEFLKLGILVEKAIFSTDYVFIWDKDYSIKESAE